MGQALDLSGGNQTQAAELLGMTFRSFRYYAKKQGLTGESPDPAVVAKERKKEFEISRISRFRYRTRFFSDSGLSRSILGSNFFFLKR